MDFPKTSIKEIIEKVFRDNGYTTEVDFFDAVVWAAEAIDLIGAPQSLEDNIITIDIEDHKGKLPCGWVYIQATRDKNSKLPYRYESGTFFHNCHTIDSPDLKCVSDLTYKVNNNYIFTSKDKGCIELAYKGYPTDEEGYPLIIDSTRYKTAIASYIRYKVDYKLLRQNKLAMPIYQMSEQEWLFYVNSANTNVRMPSVDQMESLKNQVLRLIPQVNAHQTGFKSLGEQERRYNN